MRPEPIALILVGIIAAFGDGLAAPPVGADPDSAVAQWFHQLLVPDGDLKGGLCCDVADCRPVAAREVDGHWEVWIDDQHFHNPSEMSDWDPPNAWVKVPPEAVIHRSTNPMGEPVACWYGGKVRCFVEGPQT